MLRTGPHPNPHSSSNPNPGGLNFEEYLVLRSFSTMESLEAQYRFLWHLLDRDADGGAHLRMGLALILTLT